MTESFAEGDLVEVVKGELRHTNRLVASTVSRPIGRLYMEGFKHGQYVDTLEDDGYTITVIEKALPPLPTEPGTVIRFRGNFGVWQLFGGGRWQNSVEGNRNSLAGEALVEVYGSDFEVFEATK